MFKIWIQEIKKKKKKKVITYLLYYVYFLEFFTHENLFSKVFKSQNSIYNSQGFLVSIKIQVWLT